MTGINNQIQTGTTPLPVNNGGTGHNSVTVAPSASSWAGWDANSNISANNFISGYATTVTAAATTTLLVGSAEQQFFSGSTSQTVLLPVTSTLVLGQRFIIVNNSSGVVTVQSSGANTIQAMAANTSLVVTVILTSGTTAASWYAQYAIENALALPLSLANGGTNASLTASNGGIFYSTASAGAILAGTATANQLLMSGSSTTPAWSTATYPATTTANAILYSSASNVVGQITVGADGVLVSNASNVPSWLANGTAGFVLTAQSGAAPAWAAIPSSGLAWSTVSGATQAAAVNSGYIINGSGCTVTLPATAAVGAVVAIKGVAGTWITTANTSQTIVYGATSSSSAGTVTSAIATDGMQVTCIVANTTWSVDYAVSSGLTFA